MEGRLEVETLEKLKSSGLQAACHLSGERLSALQQLMAGINDSTVSDFDLLKRAGCSCFEFASFLTRIKLHRMRVTHCCCRASPQCTWLNWRQTSTFCAVPPAKTTMTSWTLAWWHCRSVSPCLAS